MPTFIIHGKLRAHHVGVLVNARRTLLQEHTRALHVGVPKVESTVSGFRSDGSYPRTRNAATSLANVPQVVAGFLILQRRIDPKAVLLPARSAEDVRLTVRIDEGVLTIRGLAVRVGKHIAILILRTKIENVRTGIAAKLVGLRGVDRGNRAVNILELHVHRGVIDTHGSIQRRRRTRFLQADGTRQRCKSVRHIDYLRDITVGDTIRFDQLRRIRNRSSSNRARRLGISSQTNLRGCNRLNSGRNQRKRQCRRSHGRTAATSDVVLLHKSPFRGISETTDR